MAAGDVSMKDLLKDDTDEDRRQPQSKIVARRSI
jgi:hypothetical protein